MRLPPPVEHSQQFWGPLQQAQPSPSLLLRLLMLLLLLLLFHSCPPRCASRGCWQLTVCLLPFVRPLSLLLAMLLLRLGLVPLLTGRLLHLRLRLLLRLPAALRRRAERCCSSQRLRQPAVSSCYRHCGYHCCCRRDCCLLLWHARCRCLCRCLPRVQRESRWV